jgi:uncharacterized protein YkwD
MKKLTPIAIIALALLVVFVVPNQNGQSVFAALQSQFSPKANSMEIVSHSATSTAKLSTSTSSLSMSSSSAYSNGVNIKPKDQISNTPTNGSKNTQSQNSNSPQTTSETATASTSVRGNASGTIPITIPSAASYDTLTAKGVLEWTNYYRAQNGLYPLKVNTTLVTAATLKVYDMFKNQYFEHVSPSGKDISDVVSNLGYDYITVGENLALGDFKSSKDLVDAWMASPGHRANILNKTYEQIGIAMTKGQFKGNDVWLASQEFAKPKSSCPSPDQRLKTRIDIARQNVSKFSDQLDQLRNTLQNSDRSNISAYNTKVDQYNKLAKSINSLNQDLKGFVQQYNTQVDAFNKCAAN